MNEVEAAGNTPLHSAAYEGWIEGAELLLSLGAKVNASNNAGDRAWHWAQNMDHEDMMAFLVKVCPTPGGGASYMEMLMGIAGAGTIAKVMECACMQNGAKTAQGDVLVPDHIPKVKVCCARSNHFFATFSYVWASTLQAWPCWAAGLLQQGVLGAPPQALRGVHGLAQAGGRALGGEQGAPGARHVSVTVLAVRCCRVSAMALCSSSVMHLGDMPPTHSVHIEGRCQDLRAMCNVWLELHGASP